MATEAQKGGKIYDRGQKNTKWPKRLLYAGAAVVGIGGTVAGGLAVKSALDSEGTNGPDTNPNPNLVGNSPTPSATTVTEVPTPSAEPTPEATPISGYITNPDGSISYRTETGAELNVPTIDGLSVKLEDTKDGQKVVYSANADNPYGLSPEAYAGEFKPNVVVEENQTGGVVLKPPVVLKLLNDKLATIPNQTDKWAFPLPLDVTNTEANIYLALKEGYGDYKVPIAELSFTSKIPLPVTNILTQAEEISVISNTYYKNIYIDSFRLVEPNTDYIIAGQDIRYITVGGFLGRTGNLNSSFGDKIGDAGGKVAVSVNSALEWRDVDANRILTALNSPIFLATN